MKKVILIAALAASALFAESFSWHDSVRVIRSEPIYRTVTVRTPIEECWDEEVPVSRNDDGTLGAIIGGAAGGILGHQVGGGSGKTAATVGGAIIGTLVGKNLSEQGSSSPSYRIERRCKTRYKERTENRFVGYKNYARYKGREIVKFSDEPLKRIDVTVTVTY
ncbi:glycine zipper 2TM domain-containing protein [Hydrogenimonas cancrithermarum]|uniref:Glycine zipper 2TM domain-containing protein n=1 Tax=Hydrogenimonas cancrithermarum TaxID=2993563 RepID=A0ABM8FJX0_9BACT|nr:glycine zipper 2TM domain-containing protein [Hydrogenimonas cancrithermarum]BDY12596.1 hypothetical protein HCR_09080 [Hydrogenimonas cancrithermarum]